MPSPGYVHKKFVRLERIHTKSAFNLKLHFGHNNASYYQGRVNECSPCRKPPSDITSKNGMVFRQQQKCSQLKELGKGL